MKGAAIQAKHYLIVLIMTLIIPSIRQNREENYRYTTEMILTIFPSQLKSGKHKNRFLVTFLMGFLSQFTEQRILDRLWPSESNLPYTAIQAYSVSSLLLAWSLHPTAWYQGSSDKVHTVKLFGEQVIFWYSLNFCQPEYFCMACSTPKREVYDDMMISLKRTGDQAGML